MLRLLLSFVVLLMAIQPKIYAQGTTTASLDGKVTNIKGESLPGATVRVEHLPTSSIHGAITNDNGRFTLLGLKPGGPYRITVSMVGYTKETVNEVKLNVNQNYTYNFKLQSEDIQVDEIQVTSDRTNIISSGRTGAAQTVTETEIVNMPTIERSLSDYTRLTPQVVSSGDGSSASGRSSRYNNIQVDGASINDGFGLDESGTPGGQVNTEPISLDAIQEFEVNVAPYDVRQSNFTGAYINAITRSGSNDISASAYAYGRNQSLVGVGPDINETPYNDFRQIDAGGRLGGPVIKNKMFFFVNGEVGRRTSPRDVEFNDPNAAFNIPVEKDILAEIANIAKDQYGYDPGDYSSNYSIPNNNYKIFGRLDYNITDKHRLTFRHNLVSGFRESGVNRYSDNFSYEGSAFDFTSVQNQSVFQLNSIFSENMFNELRVSFTAIRDKRDPIYEPFPFVSIRDVAETDLNVNMGIERYSQANSLDQDILEITDNFNMIFGDHTVTIGTQNQIFSYNNLFIRNYYGYYEFQSIEDFREGNVGRFRHSYSLLENNDKPRANWDMVQFGGYIQDEWNVADNLKLHIGLRGDYIMLPDEPFKNPKVNSVYNNPDVSAFVDNELSTTKLPTMFMISPRLGFNWDVNEDQSTQLRGGFGVFAGRTPGVWLSNQYTNTGVDIARVDMSSYDLPEDFKFSPDPYNQPELPGDPTTEINLLDEDFTMPQLLRSNIGMDQKLGSGFIGTVDLIYSKTLNDVLFKDVNKKYKRDDNGNIVEAPDGRPIYSDEKVSDDFTNVIYMTDTDRGYQYNLTFQLRKPWGQGLLPRMDFNASYTYTMAKDLNSATSSQAYSNWRYNPVMDPNDPRLGSSNYEVPHRFLLNISYNLEYFENLSTRFGFYYEGRSGNPFTFVYRTSFGEPSANNDGEWSNDIAYIPEYRPQNDREGEQTGQDPQNVPDVILSSGNWWELERFLSRFDGIDEQRGKVMERNSLYQAWQHQIDFRLTQEIEFAGNQSIELTFDILNVLNLINSDWGHIKYVRFNSHQLFTFEGYEVDPRDGQEKPVVDFSPQYFNKDNDGEPTIYEKANLGSRWQLQIGLRYNF